MNVFHSVYAWFDNTAVSVSYVVQKCKGRIKSRQQKEVLRVTVNNTAVALRGRA